MWVKLEIKSETVCFTKGSHNHSNISPPPPFSISWVACNSFGTLDTQPRGGVGKAKRGELKDGGKEQRWS